MTDIEGKLSTLNPSTLKSANLTSLKSARRTVARELRERLERLRTRIQVGSYNDRDLRELAAILREIRAGIAGNDTRMSEVIGISAKSIANTYSRGNSPRYVNFVRMVSGGIELCRKAELDESIDPGLAGLFEHSGEVADWRTIPKHALQRKISELASSLDEVLLLARGSNTTNELVLTDIQRAQLIAMLETGIVLLKAPMVEVGLLRRLTKWLKGIGKRAAESEIESALGSAARHAEDLLGGFIDSI